MDWRGRAREPGAGASRGLGLCGALPGPCSASGSVHCHECSGDVARTAGRLAGVAPAVRRHRRRPLAAPPATPQLRPASLPFLSTSLYVSRRSFAALESLTRRLSRGHGGQRACRCEAAAPDPLHFHGKYTLWSPVQTRGARGNIAERRRQVHTRWQQRLGNMGRGGESRRPHTALLSGAFPHPLQTHTCSTAITSSLWGIAASTFGGLQSPTECTPKLWQQRSGQPALAGIRQAWRRRPSRRHQQRRTLACKLSRRPQQQQGRQRWRRRWRRGHQLSTRSRCRRRACLQRCSAGAGAAARMTSRSTAACAPPSTVSGRGCGGLVAVGGCVVAVVAGGSAGREYNCCA